MSAAAGCDGIKYMLFKQCLRLSFTKHPGLPPGYCPRLTEKPLYFFSHEGSIREGSGFVWSRRLQWHCDDFIGYGHMQEAVQRMTIQSMGQLPVPLSANALTHLQIVQAAADNAERCVQEAEQ